MNGEISQHDFPNNPTTIDFHATGVADSAAFGKLFQRLPPTNRVKLSQRSKAFAVLRDQVIVRQGDPGRFYYFVRRGRLVVTQTVAGTIQRCRELVAGDRFGEDAIITGQPQPASVTACEPGEVLRIEKEDFLELLLAPVLCVVNVANAQRLIRCGASWIDARTTPEPAPGFINEAIKIDAAALRQSGAVTLNPTARYIVFCNDGSDSALVTFLLAEQGFTVAYLAGGLGVMRTTASANRLHARPRNDCCDMQTERVNNNAQQRADANFGEVRYPAKTKPQRLPPQPQRRGSRSELLLGSAAERSAIRQRREAILMQRLRTDVERWRNERAEFENSPEQRHRSAHLTGLMDAIKRRANAARLAAKQHDQTLLDELSTLLNASDDRKP